MLNSHKCVRCHAHCEYIFEKAGSFRMRQKAKSLITIVFKEYFLIPLTSLSPCSDVGSEGAVPLDLLRVPDAGPAEPDHWLHRGADHHLADGQHRVLAAHTTQHAHRTHRPSQVSSCSQTALLSPLFLDDQYVPFSFLIKTSNEIKPCKHSVCLYTNTNTNN